MQALSNNQKKLFLLKKQKAVLLYLHKGMSNKEIARQVFINHRTVEEHLRNLSKLFFATDSIHLITLTHPAREMELIRHPKLTLHENGILHQRKRYS